MEFFNDLYELSINAGKKILNIYNSGDIELELKNDDSPLTKADLVSNETIMTGLKKINYIYSLDYPVLSEESKKVDYKLRKDWDKYWLIDPLDGTKEFVKKNGEFTVNIALIHDQIPIIGFVYAPVLDVLYYGDINGAFKVTNASKKIKKKVKLNYKDKRLDKLKIVASNSHLNEETKHVIDSVKKLYDNYDFISYGSSLKLCKIADGSADLYPRIAPTMEWDTAAADAVCRAAGISVLSMDDHKPLLYNKKVLLNPFFYVTGNKQIKKIMESV